MPTPPAPASAPAEAATEDLVGPRWPRRTALVGAALGVAALGVAVLLGVLLGSPWTGEPGPGSGETPTTRPNATPGASTSGPSVTGPATPTASPTAVPTPSTTRGSVGVGTVVVAPGQPCTFTQVGVREQTVSGVDVVCSRRDDGSYAWVAPSG